MNNRIVIIIAVAFIVGAFLIACGAAAAFYYLNIGPFSSRNFAIAPVHRPADFTPGLLTDSGHYENENNWIAATIAQEMTGLCWLAAHPNGPVPTFDIKATVDPQKATVHLVINGWLPDKPITADLTPAYAWDPVGYAPLARQLIGDQKNSDPATADSSDLLNDLLTPTGKVLATKDGELSRELLQSPASAALHDKAALLLLTLALRENAGVLTDPRRPLCRATSHLALAQALRGDAPAAWPGKIANAALITLSGREVDALAHLDALSAAPDATDSAKTWIRILRLDNKQDWRMEDPDGQSPLLLKIIWFRTLAENVNDTLTASHLHQMKPLEQVPDWGRALLAGADSIAVDVGHRICTQTIGLEFREISEILAAENNPVAKGTPLSKVFNDPIANSVTVGPNGTNTLNIIGTGLFEDISLRHLFLAVYRTHYWLKNSWGVPDQDAKFTAEMLNLFRGVPREKYLPILFDSLQHPNRPPANGLQDDLATIPPAFAFVPAWPESECAKVKAYFGWDIPFNAPYAMNTRCTVIYQIKLSPVSQGGHRLPCPSFSDLKPLAPDSYIIASWTILIKLDPGGHMTKDEEQALLSPFFDYSTFALSYFRSLSKKQNDFDDATLEQILRKQCALDPDENFMLGDFLQAHGQPDAAAEAYRTGVHQARDPVLVANSVLPLVQYDFAHGQQDEAQQVAQNAADVYSALGIETYIWLLCQQGHFDEAEDWARKEQERYGGHYLTEFYVSHQDHFSSQYKDAERTLYPNGLPQVTLASFTGPPKEGEIIAGSSPLLAGAGLQEGDVIVALDSHPVKDTATYEFVRALKSDPAMDFIIWRNGKYIEVKPSLPGRRFKTDIQPYHP